jgi:lysozyme family protein
MRRLEMANFDEAYSITYKHEGGYSMDKDDVGGETYKGIARRYHPSWGGWSVIDLLKTKPNFPQSAYDHGPLNDAVKKFYKEKYWDINLLDYLSSQEVANEMFDTGVNMGTHRAAKFLQQALNLLNKNGKLYADIVVDGKIGRNTLKAFNACINYRGDEYLYKILNILQGNHYLEYMSKSPTQEKFAYGWLKRVDFIKN